MLPKTMRLAAIAVLAGCASSGRPIDPVVEEAVRFGVEACERHFLEGLPMERAVAAAANGRQFVRVEKHFEEWTGDPKPWRLAGTDVWVGMTDEGEDAVRCRILALEAGSMSLRDAIMAEHVARADRAWTAWPTHGGGARAVCTTDRVPEGKSVLVTAYFQADMNLGLENVARSPIAARFSVSVVNERTCERNS